MNARVTVPDDAQEITPQDMSLAGIEGIFTDISNEAYHAGQGISKSGLWTIYEKTPAHFKFPPVKKETTQTQAIKDFGTAAHLAILEPDDFEKLVIRGPEDRKGNKWKDLINAPDNKGKLVLVETAYDDVLAIRDAVHRDNFINQLLTCGDGINEATGYVIDEQTGMLRRVRPDRYRRDLGVIVDIKSTECAAPKKFKKSVVNYGYHSQEAFYTDAWRDLGCTVNGFVFVAWEKKSPYAKVVWELPPSIVEEGREIMRNSLNTYADCFKADHWPAYGDGVQELTFDRWDYKNTRPPEDDEDEASDEE
jgi:exodeoxyribonuclease VIII